MRTVRTGDGEAATAEVILGRAGAAVSPGTLWTVAGVGPVSSARTGRRVIGWALVMGARATRQPALDAMPRGDLQGPWDIGSWSTRDILYIEHMSL